PVEIVNALRQGDLVLAEVPVPGADLAGVQGQAQPFLALPQTLLGQLAGRDVSGDAVPDGAAVRKGPGGGAAVQPAEAAAARPDPELALERLALTVRFLLAGAQAREVVFVDHAVHGGRVSHPLLRGESEERLDAAADVGEADLAGRVLEDLVDEPVGQVV